MSSIAPETLRPLEVPLPAYGVAVLESHHGRDFRADIDQHDFFQLLSVLRGAGTLHCPTQTPPDLSLCAGDVVLIPPAAPHRIQDAPHTPLSIYAVNLAPAFLADLPALAEHVRRLRRPALSAAMPDLLRRLLLEQTLRHDGFQTMMRGLSMQLLATLTRHQQPTTAPIEGDVQALTRVRLYYDELQRTFYREQSLDAVARELGLSRRRFTETFRQVSGDSWLKTVRRLRVQHAQTLLRDRSRTVLAIAFECGWEELSSFYRAFKAETGSAPDVWRKSLHSEVEIAP